MSMNIEDVKQVAHLARLALTEDEATQITAKLNVILQYCEKLNELDTTEIEPTSHTLPLVNVMRADEVRPSLPIQEVLRNAPEEEDDQFKVPAILE